MKLFRKKSAKSMGIYLSVLGLTVGVGYFLLASNLVKAQDETGRLITVYDRGEQISFITTKQTLKDAFAEQKIELDARDGVEPSLNEELVAADYHVNIYRARPVTVIDGATRQMVMTPYQSAERIVRDVGVVLYDEDIPIIKRSDNLVADGAGLQLTIDRATPFILDLYGNKTEIRTQGATVADMLEEKDIAFGESGRASVPLSTPITSGMVVRVWREGKQTVTLEEVIPFDIEKIRDADQPIGYKATQTVGANGLAAVSYEIEVKDGVELSRAKIASVTKKAAVKQVEVIGIKYNGTGLTKGMGVKMFTDSKGIVHRETYYDLPMAIVMGACGQGGQYSVREDGVKVDVDGYIIVAANYARYPRCSVVETSLGLGKVYDTGGFAARHPEGYDLATDWTNYNGI